MREVKTPHNLPPKGTRRPLNCIMESIKNHLSDSIQARIALRSAPRSRVPIMPAPNSRIILGTSALIPRMEHAAPRMRVPIRLKHALIPISRARQCGIVIEPSHQLGKRPVGQEPTNRRVRTTRRRRQTLNIRRQCKHLSQFQTGPRPGDQNQRRPPLGAPVGGTGIEPAPAPPLLTRPAKLTKAALVQYRREPN